MTHIRDRALAGSPLTLVDCGCVAYVYQDGSGIEIEYCPTHKAAPKQHDTLVFLDTAIMPDGRKYDEWGYCRIHRDILEDFDRRIKAAIRAATGEG